jgi:sulfur-oxidizing protein SoxY
MSEITRRQALAATAGAFVVLRSVPALATPESMQAAIHEFTKGAKINEGRVKLDVTLLVENGNSVPLSVSVESPMTPADYVMRIAVFNEKNPLPQVAVFQLTPRCGRPSASTRIRLGDSQIVTAIAEMKDGTFWSASSEVIVTLPACVEG